MSRKSEKKTVAQFEESERWVRVDKDGHPIGEPQEVNVLVKQISRNDFAITYLADIIRLIDELGNKKMKVVKYILQNMDKSTNKLTETVREIAEHVGCNKDLVSETLRKLEEVGYVARKTGVVMLSPKIAHKGDAKKERYLMTKFYAIKEENSGEEY